MQSRVLAWPRTVKRLVVLALDVVLALVATWLAFTLRLEQPNNPQGLQWAVYALCATLFIPVFIRFGLYRAIFRYTGQAALVATAKAVAVYGAMLSIWLLVAQWLGVPRSLGVLQPLIFLLLVGASRAMARLWLADASRAAKGTVFLIFGAGTAGVQTAAALAMSRQFELAGFVDDDASKVGRSINGVRVYAANGIEQLIDTLGIQEVLLALPQGSRARRREIIESLRHLPVHVRTLPAWADVASGRVTVQDFKELDIEDLLGRDPVPPDSVLLHQTLTGKVVLVTGAGGSIGSELCRQILAEQPRGLVLLDHNEFGLYNIEQELRGRLTGGATVLVPLLGSVTDRARLHEVCQAYRPQVVFHAAAYKHVPLVEANPAQGLHNNVFGTLYTAQAAIACGVESFVLVSTDKAVRPTNVMGASKRMAELVLQALAEKTAQDQGTARLSMVRFGNVLGSSGSVVPLFRKQISEGGPLTVTHAEVTRYFMTIPEAAQLVLLAGAMAHGGEVFVLDMGEPVKIIDLARRMVELSGLKVRDDGNPGGDIAITVTGLRPGEKLYEELLIGDNPSTTSHPRIMKAHESFLPWEELQAQLDALAQAVGVANHGGMQTVLQHCVRGYEPAAPTAAK